MFSHEEHIIMEKDFFTNLTNPNDVSPGQCYAPIIQGKPDKNKKKHFLVGEDPPRNWQQVPCDAACPNN